MTEALSISGYVVRQSGAMKIKFQVEGALDLFLWRRTCEVVGRCHELWRHTCFEVFFGIKGDPAYWEVNLSPNNCWNVYHFTNYRSQMQEEGSIRKPICHVVQDAGLLSFSCTLDYTGLIDDSSDLEVGVSSVIKATDGSTSYWAIEHHGTEPDFHNRTGFSMLLPGVKNAR
jgi:hypothetical protein